MTETLVFLALVLAFVVAGVRVGMLVAARLSRWSERDDEEPHDD